MLCSQCGNEMKVRGGRYVVSGDDSPDVDTKLRYVMTLECVNPSCPARGKQEEVVHELEIGE
jgi:hypothetical protein